MENMLITIILIFMLIFSILGVVSFAFEPKYQNIKSCKDFPLCSKYDVIFGENKCQCQVDCIEYNYTLLKYHPSREECWCKNENKTIRLW